MRRLAPSAVAWLVLSLWVPALCPGAEADPKAPAQAPTMDVQRDKDKTVYRIGNSDKDREKDDADKAWQMLDNVIIDTRGAHGKGPNNNR